MGVAEVTSVPITLFEEQLVAARDGLSFVPAR